MYIVLLLRYPGLLHTEWEHFSYFSVCKCILYFMVRSNGCLMMKWLVYLTLNDSESIQLYILSNKLNAIIFRNINSTFFQCENHSILKSYIELNKHIEHYRVGLHKLSLKVIWVVMIQLWKKTNEEWNNLKPIIFEIHSRSFVKIQ
jgi:hypothetical protein